MSETIEATSSEVSPAPSAKNVETATTTEAPVEQEQAPIAEPDKQPTTDDGKSTLFTKLQDEAKEEEPEPVEPPAPEVSESKPEGEEAVTEEPETPAETEEEPVPAHFKLKRAELRQFEEDFLVPFRDPEADVMTAVEALYKFLPTRTTAMVESMLQESAKAYPEQWLAAITGVEGLTVEQVKKALERPEGTPIAPEQTDLAFSEEMKALTARYGEDWKDPEKDYLLGDDDRWAASLIRDALSVQAKAKQEGSEELTKLKEELAELKPQIDEIKSASKLAFENDVDAEYQKSVRDYREAVETKAFPVIFKERGLDVSETDAEEVKGVKEAVTAAFKPPYGNFNSDFDMFTTYQFSQREEFAKTLKRVDTYKRQAAEKQIQSKNETDKAKAERLASEAASLNNQAEMEQDTITVWTQKAADEFLKTPRMSAMTKLLETNADLQRRLAQVTDRPELIGSAAVAANGNSWQDGVKARLKETSGEATGFLAERLAGVNR